MNVRGLYIIQTHLNTLRNNGPFRQKYIHTHIHKLAYQLTENNIPQDNLIANNIQQGTVNEEDHAEADFLIL